MTSPDLVAAIEQGMLSDQAELRRRLERLDDIHRQAQGQRARSRLESDIRRSAERRRQRLAALPDPVFSDELPVAVARDRIADAIARNQVVIVGGDTGSGKTTQLPKICLLAGRGVSGYIGHTQPRRIAARGVAMRLAEELAAGPAKTVGHKIRFDQDVGRDCFIKLMTDGILLTEIQADPMLLSYDTIIIDEAHERSLNVDFLLGYLKTLLPKRPELKLIISSATIDTRRFSDFFDGAPVIEVEGRTFPIEMRYVPPEDSVPDSDDRVARAINEVERAWDEEKGDILVFFPGERDIHEALRRLRGTVARGAEVLPLYARLPLAAQRRILTPGARRRVVLATNVAETSITVPRVRVVVDTGVARISRYNRHTGVTRLPVEPVSRASADQRAGRCGRTGPGVCVRLYAKEDYSQRTPYTEAEILRSNLAAVLLRMRALGLKDLADFPFIDPPDKRHVNDGLRLLRELRALDDEDELTALGRRLARLPLEPRLGSMLLAAEAQDCVADILIIAAGLSVTDPRLRPAGREIAADAAHRRTADERSDFVSLLNLWDLYHDRTRGQSDDARHAFCRKRFLSLSRIREWQDVHDQLRQIAAEMGIRRGRRGATYARIHKALLAGLLRNIGFLNAEHEYTGVRGAAFRAAPGSAQHTARAKWIVAAEIVETSRLYAFTAARIRPEWVEAAAGDLIRKSYFDAHWDRKRGQCMVYEQCALYGLTIIPGRRRRYAPVSPAEARRIFIRSALVDDQIDSDAGFLAHNRAVLARLRGYEDRLRQPDVFISDDTLFEFYDHLVPGHVFDLQSFDRWNRDLDQDEFEALCLDHDALVARKLTGDMETRYPDRIELGGHQFELRYRFAPGAPDDGVTMLVPMELLADIDPRPVGWLVPGFLEEKASALMRSLPKAYRREIVPLNEVLEAFDPNGFVPGTSLGWALSEHLRRIRGVDVPDAEWDDGRLAPHLRMNFQVVGSDGTALEAGRDLARLQRRFARRKPDSAAESGRSAPDAAYTDWRFGDIPAQAETVRGARTVNLYPALEDHDDVVALSMAESPERARQMHRVGVRRLFLLSQQREIRRHVKREGQLDQLQLAYTLVDEPPPEWARRPAPRARSDNGGSLSREIVSLAATVALGNGSALDVRSEADFRALSEAGITRFPDALSSVCGLCSDILDGYRGVRKLLAESRIPAKQESLDDVHGHLHGLVYRGFLNLTPVDQLRHYPRYLGALEKRIEKLREGGSRDSDKVAILAPLWRRFVARAGEHLARGRYDEELERYRWMMEELRVSLFAQEVGTAHPVSTKRLDRQWAKVMP